MKKSIAGLCVLFASYMASAAPSDEILSKAEQKSVLSLIDDGCADSWCEGSFDYKFNWIKCSASKEYCVVGFTMIDTDSNKKPAPTWNTFCTVRGITSVDHVIEKTNGYDSLNQKFYEDLGSCIDRRGNDFPRNR